MWSLDYGQCPGYEDKLMAMEAWGSGGDADNMWGKTASCTRKEAREVFGVSRGRLSYYLGDWWWNGEVQKKVEA